MSVEPLMRCRGLHICAQVLHRLFKHLLSDVQISLSPSLLSSHFAFFTRRACIDAEDFFFAPNERPNGRRLLLPPSPSSSSRSRRSCLYTHLSSRTTAGESLGKGGRRKGRRLEERSVGDKDTDCCDRLGEISTFIAYFLVCLIETQPIGKHRIYQTCHGDLEV